MGLDLQAMKAAALAATHGRWRLGRKVASAVYAGDDPTAPPVCLCDSMGELPAGADAANAQHIVTSNPAAVLALIARLERAEAELRQIYNEQAEAVGWRP